MPTQSLTPEQLDNLQEVRNPALRRRFALYYQLPEDVQEQMFAKETADTVWQLVQEKHNLPREAVNPTAKVIGLVMLGEIPVNDFIRELASALRTDTERATALAKDINEQIFQPVRESLLQVHGIQKTEKKEQEPRKERSRGVSLDELEEKEVRSKKQKEHDEEQGANPVRDRPAKDTATTAPGQSVSNEVKKLEVNGEQKKQSEALREGQERARREAEARRQQLIQRLKQAKGKEREQAEKVEADQQEDQPSQEQSPSSNKGSNPQATTAAWNGSSINLDKIPPRRESPKKNNNTREV